MKGLFHNGDFINKLKCIFSSYEEYNEFDQATLDWYDNENNWVQLANTICTNLYRKLYAPAKRQIGRSRGPAISPSDLMKENK